MSTISAKVFTGDFAATSRAGRGKSEETIAIESILAATFHDSQARVFDGGYEDADKFMARVRVVANSNDFGVSVRKSADGEVVVTAVRPTKGMTDKVKAFIKQYPKAEEKAAAPKPTAPAKATKATARKAS